MIFGFHFNANSGESLQFVVDTEQLQIAARATIGGEWKGWKRLDVDRKADGTLDERVEEANVAKRADTAGRLYAPVKISCSGVVSGVVEIDGSKDVLLSLSGTAGLDGIISEAIKEHVKTHHTSSGEESGGSGGDGPGL